MIIFCVKIKKTCHCINKYSNATESWCYFCMDFSIIWQINNSPSHCELPNRKRKRKGKEEGDLKCNYQIYVVNHCFLLFCGIFNDDCLFPLYFIIDIDIIPPFI